MLFFALLTASIGLSQTNVSVATATLVNSFPHTETNVNSIGGGTAIGMGGSCSAIPCCSTLVYRVETPSYGSLRVEMENWTALGGSIIAYTPNIDNPQDWSDLTYLSSPGNFCGFRDTLELGISYNWTSYFWGNVVDPTNIWYVIPPGTYYLLMFNYNNQAGIGSPQVTLNFDFVSYCPDGYSCSNANVSLCDGDGYLSPTGNLYTTSGSYQDTLFGAANGGVDSLIFTAVTINHSAVTEDNISDEALCFGSDTLNHPAYTELVSFADFDKSSGNWVNCNSVVPSLINNDRSMFCWMKKSTTVSSSSQVLIGMNTSGTSTISNFLIGTNEKIGVYDGGSFHYGTTTVTDGAWHFVGYTYDDTSNETKIYVDGVVENTYTNGQHCTSSGDRISLGQEYDGSSTGNYLDGLLTEVSVWNEVLDSTDIALNMQKAIVSSHPKYSNLVAYYPMNVACGGDNQILTDYSGNSNFGDASHTTMILTDSLQQIDNFNAATYFTKDWIANGSSLSTADTLNLTTYSSGSYQLTLERDYYTITDSWTLTEGAICGNQCAGPTNNFQSFTNFDMTPSVQGAAGTLTDSTNWGAGDYWKLNVIAGESYLITTCNGNIYSPGDYQPWPHVRFDPQLTLQHNVNLSYSADVTDTVVAYNDDHCGVFPEITYTAPFTGEILIVMDSSNNCDYYSVDSVIMSVTWLAPSIVISEISYNGPESGTDSTEYIELYNNSSSTVDLSGYVFTSGVIYTFPAGITVGANDYIVVGVDSIAIGHTYGYNNAYQWTGGGLSNGGEPITLKNSLGVLVDSVRYDDVNPWPSEPDGDGYTLVLCDPTADNTDGSNWVKSGTSAGIVVNGKDVYGSPGAQDNACSTGCTNTASTINPIACTSYTSPSGNYIWTSTGSYMDTIPNVAGCDSIITINLTINNTSTLVATIVIDSLPSCNGFADAGATSNATGGNTPYTYLWSNSATTASIAGVMAGTYNVTVTDTDGCTAGDTTTITEPLVLTSTMAVDSNVSCFGLMDGGATVSPSGGTTPYSYGWSNSATTASIAGVGAGTYIVTVTDANGCSVNDTAIITEPVTLRSVMAIDSNVSCFGLMDGGAIVVPSGGTLPYTYLWSNSATTASIAGVGAGTYIVTVTDANGCSVNDTAIIIEPLVLTSTMVVDSNVSCFGLMDAGATVSPAGGTTPYSYGWSNSATTASISGVGVGTYIVTVTDNNGCSVNDTAIITEPLVLTSTMVVDSNVSCFGLMDGGATVSPLGGTSPYTYLWSNSATTASITGVGAGTYIVTVTDANGCSVNDTAIITEPVVLASTMAVDSNVSCFGLTDGGATVSSSGGTSPFTYLWSNSATTASIAGVGAGIYIVTVTDNNGCSVNDTAIITEPALITGIDVQTTCDSYVWIDGITYTASNNTAMFTIPSVGGCDSTVTLNLTIQPSPTANAGTNATICEDASHTLSGVVTNELNVLWTTGGDGIFDDATIIGATYTPGVSDVGSGSVTLSLTAYSISPCSTDDVDNIVITIQQLPIANAGADDIVCESDSYTLMGIASDQQSVVWTTTGDGTFDDVTLLGASYTPGTNDISSGNVDLTLTSLSIAPCATDSLDTMTLTIQYLPVADAGTDGTVCETDSYQLAGLATYYQSMQWTTAGDGTFDDATIAGAIYTPGINDITNGSVDLTFTTNAITPCVTSDSDVLTLTIQYIPTADAGTDATICETDSYTLAGIATNEQNTLWTTAGDGTFDDATLVGAIYTPGTNDIANGNVLLTLTSYAISPCAVEDLDDMLITIQYLPMADAGLDDILCETDSYTLSGVVTYEQSVLWTTIGDGSFDDATIVSATYTPGTNDIVAGSVTLTMSAFAISPCAVDDSDDVVLTIQYVPEAMAGSDDIICETDSYILSGTAANYQNTLWTSTGDGTFDDATILTATYTPGTNDIALGLVDLTLTSYAISPCAVDESDIMTLSIQLLPIADAGEDATICEVDTYTLSGVASNEQNVMWTTSGDGSFDDPTIVNAIYTPGINDKNNGSTNLTLTTYAVTPCLVEDSDSMTLLIQLLPSANAGSDGEVCANDAYQLGGSAQNEDHVYWATLGDGIFDDPFALTAIYTPGIDDIEIGNVDLILFAYSISPCLGEDPDTLNIVINDIATAYAGNDDNICEDESYTLMGEVTNNSGQIWSTAGDGTFDDASSLTAVYSPGTIDIDAGFAELTLTAYGNTNCPGDAMDVVTLMIHKAPELPMLPVGPTSINLDETLISEYSINSVPGAEYYSWSLEPIEAGTIEGADTVGTAHWNADYTGLVAEIYVMVENDYCDPVYSGTLEIGISPVGVNSLDVSEMDISISPNPSAGKFIVRINGAMEDINVVILNSSGQRVKELKLINTVSEFTETVDISNQPAGNYYMKFITSKGIITKKVNINKLFR